MSLVLYNDYHTIVRNLFSETMAERVFPRNLDVHSTFLNQIKYLYTYSDETLSNYGK